jgi:hypothetical protein
LPFELAAFGGGMMDGMGWGLGGCSRLDGYPSITTNIITIKYQNINDEIAIFMCPV